MFKVTRSFSRTKQVNQFEPFVAFASWTFEDEANVLTEEDIKKFNDQTLADVEAQLEEYTRTHSEDAGVGMRRLAEMCVDLALGKPNHIDDYQNLSAKEVVFMNEVKKAYYRTPEYKNRKTNSSVENQANRGK